jgi:Type II restriction endonuclease EcoO109I
MISDAQLSLKLNEILDIFHARRINALEKQTLTKILNKNPYLFRSMGISVASDYIKSALDAFISSSDETIFGNVFFEPLARWSSEQSAASMQATVQAGGGAGFDISIESKTVYKAIAVKSGKNIFNAQSSKQQSTEFNALAARLRKEKKVLHKIIGYGYGRKTQKQDNPDVIKIAGQDFWSEITGDDNFYKRIADLLGNRAAELKIDFENRYGQKRNQLEREFHSGYTDNTGVIDWDKIIEFNSAKIKPKPARKSVIKKATKRQLKRHS